MENTIRAVSFFFVAALAVGWTPTYDNSPVGAKESDPTTAAQLDSGRSRAKDAARAVQDYACARKAETLDKILSQRSSPWSPCDQCLKQEESEMQTNVVISRTDDPVVLKVDMFAEPVSGMRILFPAIPWEDDQVWVEEQRFIERKHREVGHM